MEGESGNCGGCCCKFKSLTNVWLDRSLVIYVHVHLNCIAKRAGHFMGVGATLYDLWIGGLICV